MSGGFGSYPLLNLKDEPRRKIVELVCADLSPLAVYWKNGIFIGRKDDCNSFLGRLNRVSKRLMKLGFEFHLFEYLNYRMI
ncbi:hypothetical protein TNIN_22061 [Trichonephila inaurata madagascariensis]|uniref:Uncharacterized protein n=1 Tax=Trichonephila inaurata madagascariensis TaxID=2747483 RepID=A0A8X6YCI6_9ARAC|nr:hypothetical protein TNIN_22061 [Trichonephila inaurata madagascariensis]